MYFFKKMWFQWFHKTGRLSEKIFLSKIVYFLTMFSSSSVNQFLDVYRNEKIKQKNMWIQFDLRGETVHHVFWRKNKENWRIRKNIEFVLCNRNLEDRNTHIFRFCGNLLQIDNVEITSGNAALQIGNVQYWVSGCRVGVAPSGASLATVADR